MEIEALKRSFLPIVPIFGTAGGLLVILSYMIGQSIDGYGINYVFVTIFFVGAMYLACQYFGYKISELHYKNELDCQYEMFSRYEY